MVERDYSMVRDGLLIFNSVHKVMSAEGALKRADLDVKVMPVPRALSSDCGLSIAFALEQRGAVVKTLEEAGYPALELYRLEDDDYLKLD
jgi:hypothetical protein